VKRIALLFILMMALCLGTPACAWEVSPQHISLAEQLLPGYRVLSGISYQERTALLVTAPERNLHLAFCSNDSVSLTQPLPQKLFWIADAKLDSDTAMLILEDYEGTAYFAGCIREADHWQAAVSTPLPEGTELWHTGTPTPLCWLKWTVMAPDPEDTHQHEFSATVRQQDTDWLVTAMLLDDHLYLGFEDGFVHSESQCAHGELLFSLDISKVSWDSLPVTVEAAAEQMSLDDWAILKEESSLHASPAGTPLARLNPGVPLLILGYDGSWAQVSPGGGTISGWMPVSAMLIGRQQLEAHHLSPIDCLIANRNGGELDVYPYPSDDPSNPLLIHLNRQQAIPVYSFGEWMDGGWTLIYDPAIPGSVGFVRTEQMDAELGGALG